MTFKPYTKEEIDALPVRQHSVTHFIDFGNGNIYATEETQGGGPWKVLETWVEVKVDQDGNQVLSGVEFTHKVEWEDDDS